MKTNFKSTTTPAPLFPSCSFLVTVKIIQFTESKTQEETHRLMDIIIIIIIMPLSLLPHHSARVTCARSLSRESVLKPQHQPHGATPSRGAELTASSDYTPPVSGATK